MLDIAQEAVRESLAGLDVETPPTHRQFSSTITLPAGPLKGKKYNPNSDRCQSYLIDQLDSGLWERVAVCGPPQLAGKTQCAILLPALRAAIACKLPVGYGLPTLNDLDKAWSEKLKPSIEGGGYGDRLPKMGPGARGGRAPVLTFQDPETGLPLGRLVFLAGGAYGSTVAVVVVDEVDQFRKADGEPLWEDLEDMFHRADSFRERAIRIAVGTVEHDTKSIILVLVRDQGTGTRPWLQCPHCKAHQLVGFDQLVYDKTDEITAAETATVVCKACAVHWSESDRQKAIRHALFVHKGQTVEGGVVTGPVPRTKTLGLLWTALDSSLSSVAELAVEHLRAEKAALVGNYALMRKFVRYRQCDTYQEPKSANEITNTGLAAMSSGSDYDKRVVPHWVHNLSCGVDCQGDRSYWIVLGHGPDDRWCVIDFGWEYLVPKAEKRTPTPADRRRVHDEINLKMDEGWLIEGRTAGVDEVSHMSPLPGLRAIDVGHWSDEITAWLRGARGWRACRGVGKDTLKNLGKILELPPEAKAFVELRQPEGWPVSLVNVNADAVRKWIHASLLRKPYDPASGMLPRGQKSNEVLCMHFSGEVWVEPQQKGDKFIPGFWNDHAHPRHDLLDAAIYALALSRLRIGIQTVKAMTPRRKYGSIGNVR